MISTGVIPSSTPSAPIVLNTTYGQSGSQSVIIAGIAAGDKTGFSVADGGDVNGVTSGGSNVDDVLIGAPNAASDFGAAYLVYGSSNLANLSTTVGTVRISASRTSPAVPAPAPCQAPSSPVLSRAASQVTRFRWRDNSS